MISLSITGLRLVWVPAQVSMFLQESRCVRRCLLDLLCCDWVESLFKNISGNSREAGFEWNGFGKKKKTKTKEKRLQIQGKKKKRIGLGIKWNSDALEQCFNEEWNKSSCFWGGVSYNKKLNLIFPVVSFQFCDLNYLCVTVCCTQWILEWPGWWVANILLPLQWCRIEDSWVEGMQCCFSWCCPLLAPEAHRGAQWEYQWF